MDRREALKLAAAAALGCTTNSLVASPSATPIIDSHIHLFDTNRPGGVPWPLKSDTAIFRPALPDRYAQIARPLGVVGAIAVEASPLLSDDDWVLKQAASHPIIVGFVGDLIPGTPSYGKDLDRLRANPRFLGIRYGNLWDRDLSTDMKKPGFIGDLRKLAAYGLSFDTANPDPKLIRTVLGLSEQVPELRIIIDHLPNATLPDDATAQKEYWANVERLGRNRSIFIKLSEIPQKQASHVELDVAFYQQKLDRIWDIFGEDRILYGSDWPNSDHLATYAETLRLVRSYVSAKGGLATQKFFWKNSIAAYRWRPRIADQSVLQRTG